MGLALFGLALVIGVGGVAYGSFLLIFSKGKRIRGLRFLIAAPVLTVVALVLIVSLFDLEAERAERDEGRQLAAERRAKEEALAQAEAAKRAEEERLAAEQRTKEEAPAQAEAAERAEEERLAAERRTKEEAPAQAEAAERAEEERLAAERRTKEEEKALAEKKASEAAEEGRKMAEEHEKERKCKLDLQCWGDKNGIEASFTCDDYVPKLAKYTYEWTDGVLEPKFSRFRWDNKEMGTLTYIGDRIKFQNGFGAWQDMIYECDYNPSTKAATDVRVRPGRL